MGKKKLENVAIANALQLEAARRRAVPLRFNFVARAKFKVAQPSRCRLRAFSLLIRYVIVWPWILTPWPWPLTFDLEHLWCAGCALVKLCTKFELNRAIRGGVIAVWTLTLWPWTCTTLYLFPHYKAPQTGNKKLSYRKETVRLLHNIEIRVLH